MQPPDYQSRKFVLILFFWHGHTRHSKMRRGPNLAIQNTEYGIRNTECGMRNAECGMRNAECGMRNAECGMRNAECGMRNAERRTQNTEHRIQKVFISNQQNNLLLLIQHSQWGHTRQGLRTAELVGHDWCTVVALVYARGFALGCGVEFCNRDEIIIYVSNMHATVGGAWQLDYQDQCTPLDL